MITRRGSLWLANSVPLVMVKSFTQARQGVLAAAIHHGHGSDPLGNDGDLERAADPAGSAGYENSLACQSAVHGADATLPA